MQQSQQQQQQQRQGVQDLPQGPGVYDLGLLMGQHVDITAMGDTDIVARFRVRQLRVAVLVLSSLADFCRSSFQMPVT